MKTMDTLQDLLERGRENGVPGLELWDAAQVRAKEPNVTETAKGALWAPTAAIVNPWEFGLAMAEVAVQNGCELRRRFPVKKIEKTAEGYALSDGKDTVEARYVINAAGVYARSGEQLGGGAVLYRRAYGRRVLPAG